MIVTKRIAFDLTQMGAPNSVYAVQDDRSSRKIEIEIFENGVPWAPPDGSNVVISYRKPDGKGGIYDTLPDGSVAYTIAGNVVSVVLAPQVCTVPGVVKFTVGFLEGQQSLYAFHIDLNVQPNPGVLADSEDFYKVSGILPASGWEPNMYLATDANGNVTVKAGGGGGGSGENGATFIPSISDGGVISWTNDKGLDNPDPVDLVSKVVSALPVYKLEVEDA